MRFGFPLLRLVFGGTLQAYGVMEHALTAWPCPPFSLGLYLLP